MLEHRVRPAEQLNPMISSDCWSFRDLASARHLTWTFYRNNQGMANLCRYDVKVTLQGSSPGHLLWLRSSYIYMKCRLSNVILRIVLRASITKAHHSEGCRLQTVGAQSIRALHVRSAAPSSVSQKQHLITSIRTSVTKCQLWLRRATPAGGAYLQRTLLVIKQDCRFKVKGRTVLWPHWLHVCDTVTISGGSLSGRGHAVDSAVAVGPLPAGRSAFTSAIDSTAVIWWNMKDDTSSGAQ